MFTYLLYKLKSKHLILLTSFYPFDNKETFIENEIAYLSKSFDTVQIVAVAKLHNDLIRPIPANCSAINIGKQIVETPIKLSWFFNYAFIVEFVLNLFSNPLKNKILIRSWIKSHRIACLVKPYVKPNTLVYSYWLDDKSIALTLLKKQHPQIQTIARAHRWDIYNDEHLFAYFPMRKYLMKNIDAVYVISTHGYEYLRERYAGNYKISRLGVFENHFSLLNEKSKVFKIVTCSAVISRKRLHLVAKSLQELQVGIPVEWTHIGDGELMHELVELTKKFPTNIKVNFLGNIKNNLIASIYSNGQFNLFINVSESEGIPVSIMEAMAHSIPCIATDVGGSNEIVVSYKNGMLVSKDIQVEALKKHIQYFIELTYEKENELKENAFKTWQEEYNADDNYNAFIKEITHLNK